MDIKGRITGFIRRVLGLAVTRYARSAQLIELKMKQLRLKNVSLSVACGVSERTVTRWRSGHAQVSDRHLPTLLSTLKLTKSQWQEVLDQSVSHTLSVSRQSVSRQPAFRQSTPQQLVKSEPTSTVSSVTSNNHKNQQQADDPQIKDPQIQQQSKDEAVMELNPYQKEVLRHIRQASLPQQITAFSLAKPEIPQLSGRERMPKSLQLDGLELSEYERSLVHQFTLLSPEQEAALICKILQSLHADGK